MSNFKELFKHSGNYLLATIATHALSFVSIPVYTALLTVEEYGIINVFNSTASIATIILTLNLYVAVGRYYYDRKSEEDFNQFVGLSIILTLAVFAFFSLLWILFRNPLSRYLELEVLLTIAILPVALYSVFSSVFQQIYQPLLQSKKIAIVTSIMAYLSFGLSVVFILLLKEKRYYGQVLGVLVTMLLIGNYYVRQIKVHCQVGFKKEHLRYILEYSLPNLPYALSGLIVAQFGKLIIGQQQGFESAGLYSFASNIASIMLILITVTNSAWIPYYFTYMNEKDYKSIDEDYHLIWRLTLIGAIGVSYFGYELGALLGRPAYVHQLFLIPIFVIGYCFFQWSYVFMRNIGYERKMIWNSLITIMSGIVNVVMNTILIKPYGAFGVALSFSCSYFVMFLLGWIVNTFILKTYTPPMRNFWFPFLLSVLFMSYVLIRPVSGISWPAILIKALLLFAFSLIMLFRWRGRFVSALRGIVNTNKPHMKE